jgi:hypothetical protein
VFLKLNTGTGSKKTENSLQDLLGFLCGFDVPVNPMMNVMAPAQMKMKAGSKAMFVSL